MKLCRCPINPDALPLRTAKAIHASYGFPWWQRTWTWVLASRIRHHRCLFCGKEKR